MSMHLAPFAGELNFQPNAENSWYFEVSLPSGPVEFYIHLKSGEIAEGLGTARRAFPDLVLVDQAARDGIRKEYAEASSNSTHFVRYFEERYSPDELAEFFGTDHGNIGVEELLAAIRIEAILCNLGDEEEALVLDYKLQPLSSDQILVVSLNGAGIVVDVRMES